MKLIVPIFLAGTLLVPLLAFDPPAKHWHDDDKHRDKHSRAEGRGDDEREADHHAAGNCYFQPHDVRVISEYYAPQVRNLPPGLQKKYDRTGQLPLGWQKRIRPLPVAVERQLAPIPSGYQRGVVDGYAVIYNPRTQVTIDITAVFGRH